MEGSLETKIFQLFFFSKLKNPVYFRFHLFYFNFKLKGSFPANPSPPPSSRSNGSSLNIFS